MGDLKDGKKNEDEYFGRLEFERRKKVLEENQKEMKAKEREEIKKAHWMHCPKCGMEMVEIEFQGLLLDKCSDCGGLYFDSGELDQLLDKNKPGFATKVFMIFKD